MTSLLEITGDDIALLSDADLRELIGLLCEADFRLAGLPTKGIIWGGHQDASDDGLDVTVRSELSPPKNSFVPRRITGFQVKKPDMPRSRIRQEMRPNEKLREVIKDLVRECGAYVIVSSTGSTTEKALKARKDAMKEAVVDEPNHEQLHLDFLDRGLIANWVRSHPSYILWVRNRIGRPLQGWKPYENWANPSAGPQEEYLIDDELRLCDSTSARIDIGDGASVLDGIQTLRSRLERGTESIRLTGLSGVGKTRLVQALFDDRVGEHPLNPSLAYYTDISYSPNPDPIAFANQLLMAKTKAILIIDNCSSELHNQLTKLCAHSTVSLLTVEYDISDDVPDETDVFRLKPASDRLIEKLLEKRFTHISQINARTIAEFAGGNARVAIALANTLKRGESLSTLRHEELFKRLFYQRHDPDKSLLISAEVCSLVYSFDGVDTTAATSELQFLAELANKSVRELYRDVEQLKARGLVQSRGNWRAILPHAIANRLAKNALDSIPKNELVDAFILNGSERLIQSFTRRLGYLHDCASAIDIASDWLRPDGWLGNTNCNFNYLEITVFGNIAPIVPESALAMLERAASDESQEAFASGADAHRREFIRLLRQLAYEPELFSRSTRLLCRCALLEKPDINNSDSARTSLRMLFHIVLSGTHAPPQIRASIVKVLMDSGTQSEQQLGIDLLEAALQTDHFYTTNTSNFGARPRDFGYQPKSNQEIVAWYKLFLDICTRTAIRYESPLASDAKSVLAKRLRGLWWIGANLDQGFLKMLEESVMQIHEKQAWNAGWLSVKGILRYDGKSMAQKTLVKLKQLEKRLKPTNLLEQARTYALADKWLGFDLEDDYDENKNASSQRERVQQITKEIGAKVAQDDVAFNALLPELATYSSRHNRLDVFGEGLASGCKNRQKVWQALYSQLEQTPPEKRQISVLLGFLSSCANQDPAFYNNTLDNLVEDEMLGQWFPYFQTTSAVDTKGVERLHKSLDSDTADIDSFRQLAYGRRHEAINDDDLAALIQKILTKDGGLIVATEILQMRFHRSEGEPMNYSESLVATARSVLANFPYHEKRKKNIQQNYSFGLAQIANVCLRGEDGVELTKKICQALAKGLQELSTSVFDYQYLLQSLAGVQSYIFLDAFIGSNAMESGVSTSRDHPERDDNPVNQIPNSILISWCEQNPEIRYPQLVSSLQTYVEIKETGDVQWKSITYSILEKSPDLQAILSLLETRIYPMSSIGSLADVIEKRLVLFTSLYKHTDQEVRSWAKKQYKQFQVSIQKQRENEHRRNKQRFERFE